MSPRMQRTASWLSAVLIWATSAVPGAAQGNEYEQYKDCPWVPRSGIWRLEVGQLSVGGTWTGMGGGGGTLSVTVDSCGETISAAMGGELGTLVFERLNGGISGVPGVVARSALRHRPEVYRLPPALGPERTFLYVNAMNVPIVGMLERLAAVNGYSGELLLEAPNSFPLFEEDLYHARVVPAGEQAAMDFVLDYVTQVEMFGFSVFEGWLVPGQETAAPPFMQSYHWTFEETP